MFLSRSDKRYVAAKVGWCNFFSVESKVESEVESTVESKVEAKVESKVEAEVEAKVESTAESMALGGPGAGGPTPKILREKKIGGRRPKNFFSSPPLSNRCDGRTGATVEQVRRSNSCIFKVTEYWSKRHI